MIGIDLVHIPEFTTQLANGDEAFLRRAFRAEELQRREPVHLAGLWAAKEAVLKAAGLQPGQWLEIMITHDAKGRPSANVHGATFELSIAHHGEYAVAVAQGVSA
ncbi:MAG TPA: 4'-phosphopantetheinyl transferase superfamily protein [Candidatus Saccharimonadales bacterium]|jgi:phosphopantetheine--protein transferase-like protein|nr:4'-phosphopantetheinyl transferase superfamily protein [Candidatus Saccharimonadales bacterium]